MTALAVSLNERLDIARTFFRAGRQFHFERHVLQRHSLFTDSRAVIESQSLASGSEMASGSIDSEELDGSVAIVDDLVDGSI